MTRTFRKCGECKTAQKFHVELTNVWQFVFKVIQEGVFHQNYNKTKVSVFSCNIDYVSPFKRRDCLPFPSRYRLRDGGGCQIISIPLATVKFCICCMETSPQEKLQSRWTINSLRYFTKNICHHIHIKIIYVTHRPQIDMTIRLPLYSHECMYIDKLLSRLHCVFFLMALTTLQKKIFCEKKKLIFISKIINHMS